MNLGGRVSSSAALDRIGARIRYWRENILAFVTEQFGVEPDAWQREALEAFASHDPAKRRISLQACVGPGKSAVLAWCGLWFLGVMGARGEHPKGFCTSITAENLKANLWAEYAKWLGRSPYLSAAFTWTASRIFANDHPATWFLEARPWPKTANPAEQGKTFSGLHGEYVLVQADESGAIPPTILRAAEQALSRCTFGKILQAGNPISTQGMLYAAAGPLRHLWKIIKITADPDDPQRSPRIDLAWATSQIAAYGRENPWIASTILGQFPAQSFNTLLTVEEVEAATHRHLREDAYTWSQKRLGVDVARFGDDRTVIFPRQGLLAFRPEIMRAARTTDIAARVAKAIADWGADAPDLLTMIDDTGHWGHGAVDQLWAAGYQVMPIILSDPATDPRYRNRRAECWLTMAEWVKRGGVLPPIPELLAELTEPTYTFIGGKFALEPKDQVKRRLGRSPDLADALSLTFALADQPAELSRGLQRRSVGKALTEWTPPWLER